MSKNTQTSELINYISYNNGTGSIVLTTIPSASINTDKFLVSDSGTIKYRTAAQLLSDVGAQTALSGSGFVKISGTTISYDNSTYATQTYVGTAISNLVASAPATLDTLNELATALGNDANFATTVATSIGTKQAQLSGSGFVKISGTTISYDNSTYLTTGSASSTYLPLAGGTLTGDVTISKNSTATFKLKGATTNGFDLQNDVGGGYIWNRDNTPIYFGTNNTEKLNIGSDGTSTFKGPGIIIDRPTSSSGEPFLFFNKNGVTRGSIYGGDGTAGLRFFSDVSTFSGTLSATSATFSGSASVINTFNLYKTGGTTLGGQLAYDSAINQLYLWNNVSSGYFSIYTNSVERLTILSGGNVGINTNNPLAKLHVTYAGTDGASVKLCGTGGSTNGNFVYSLASDYSDSFPLNVFATNHGNAARTNTLVRIHSNETENGGLPLRVTAQGTIASSTYEAIAVNYIGDVGIGTSTPTAKLHVKGANARIRLTGDTYTSVEIEDGGTGDPGYIRTYNYGTANMQLGEGGTYFNVGNIGIGTSNPTAQLSGTKGLSIVDATNAALGLSNGTNHWLNYLSGTSYRIWNNSVSEVMTFLLNGKVGIGTTNPLSPFHQVTEQTNYTGESRIGGSTTAFGVVTNYTQASATAASIYVSPGYGNSGMTFKLGAGSGNTDQLVLKGDGSISIGTSSGGYKLFVSTTSTGAFNLNAANCTVGAPMIDFYDTGRSQETVISSTDGTTTGTYIASYSNHPLLLGAYANSTPTAKMTIATTGNVGIGTSSPTSLLHIGTSTSGNQKLTHWGEPGFTANYGLILRGDSSDGVFKFFGLNNGSESGSPLFSMNRASANSAFGTPTTSTYSRLNVNGSVMMNRSKYNWYQGYWTGNSTYWHMKTNLWGGGSPNGNIQYTMSLFKGYLYSYGDASIREGAYGFHNWVGTIYNPSSTGNLFTTVYVSSDGYIVLVVPSCSGETGITIDWHQAYGYPFAEAQVTAAKLYGATTGGY
jgi:hypothetical protein